MQYIQLNNRANYLQIVLTSLYFIYSSELVNYCILFHYFDDVLSHHQPPGCDGFSRFTGVSIAMEFQTSIFHLHYLFFNYYYGQNTGSDFIQQILSVGKSFR